MEAAVVLAKCPKSRQIYGMRTQKMSDGDWWRTWAFPIDERRASQEGYDATQVFSGMGCTEEYPGCPYCGATGFVQCYRCGKLSCYNGEASLTCLWCGNKMDSFVDATEFQLSGGDH